MNRARWTILLAVVAFAGCANAPKSSSQTAGLAEMPWRVQVNRVNVQKEASPLAETVALIPFGAVVNPCETNAGWFKVRVEGWVHRSALTQRPVTEAKELTLKEFEEVVRAATDNLTNGAPAKAGATSPAVPAPAKE
jgi:hypothetical protein